MSVPGLDHVAGAVEQLDRTMKKPLRPVYDAAGKLVGAERAEALDGSGSVERGSSVEARLIALETKAAAMRYCGTWRAGNSYVEGNFMTAEGSIWHANRKTSSRPGTDATWTLAVKHGRDAR